MRFSVSTFHFHISVCLAVMEGGYNMGWADRFQRVYLPVIFLIRMSALAALKLFECVYFLDKATLPILKLNLI